MPSTKVYVGVARAMQSVKLLYDSSNAVPGGAEQLATDALPEEKTRQPLSTSTL